MSLLRFSLTVCAGLCVLASATGQITWIGYPLSWTADFLAYDSHRDVVVGLGTNATQEFDGASWAQVQSIHYPGQLPAWFAYDKARQRTVMVEYVTNWTWEWDGTDWLQVAQAPVSQVLMAMFGFPLIAYHETRQRVMLIAPGVGASPVELYEWTGATWTLVPTANGPLTRPDPFHTYTYHALAFDARADKLVLFGRTLRTNGTGTGQILTPLTWEWDAANGWVSFPASGVIGHTTYMWFDTHRGQLLRHDTYNSTVTPRTVSVRNQAGQWLPLGFTGQSAAIPGCYDSLRNRYYANGGNPLIGFFTDTWPATYAAHRVGCPGSTAPTLNLAAPWTRAWTGGALVLEANALPLSVAILAMGFSDQSYGTIPLPLDLTAHGMPQCHLRVAPEATLLGLGSTGSATFQIPIPNGSSVLGVSYWQQVFAPAPGANAAGMLASDSMYGLIGRSQ